MALGASSRQVVRMFIRDTVQLIAVAAVAGLALSFLSSRVVSSLLLGVDSRDPPTFAIATLVLAGSALLASAAPAVRASRIDPMLVLRRE